MKHVRQNRKAAEPIKKAMGRPAIYTWAGNAAFKRKRKQFDKLSLMLRDDEFLHFCSAIGWVEVNWALYEAQLTHWCQIMFVTLRWRGKNGRAKDMPRPYSQKSRFLREGFLNIAAMGFFKDEGLGILDRGDALADIRNDLTHAVITHMEAKDGRFIMENRKTTSDGLHVVKSVVFDVREFPALAHKLVILGKDAVHFSDRLYKAFL